MSEAVNEPKPQQPSGGPSGATSTQLGAKHGLQKFLTPAVLALDFLAICFSLIAITDREIDENSYSYYVALAFYALTHVVYLANSFMEDPSTTNLVSRLLKNDNFQLLTFIIIFWFSWPWMWIVLPALMVPAAFQIVEVIPQLATALHLSIPPAVTGILDKVKPHKPVALNYLSVAEPLYLVYLILIIYWNNVVSIIPYFLWLCARNEYSPYTKFGIAFWAGHIEKALAGQEKIKPHYEQVKNYLSLVGKNLPK
jgi:hypothetical protein